MRRFYDGFIENNQRSIDNARDKYHASRNARNMWGGVTCVALGLSAVGGFMWCKGGKPTCLATFGLAAAGVAAVTYSQSSNAKKNKKRLEDSGDKLSVDTREFRNRIIGGEATTEERQIAILYISRGVLEQEEWNNYLLNGKRAERNRAKHQPMQDSKDIPPSYEGYLRTEDQFDDDSLR